MNIFKKLFSKHKEDNILVYVDNDAYFCNALDVNKDQEGRYVVAIARYYTSYKKWAFFKKKTRVYIDDRKVKYMDHNILKTLDIK